MTMSVNPGFSIHPGDAIMTIGSCFARELEAVLATRGFDVPAMQLSIPPEERPPGTKPNVILNKYTVHAMENEIRWLFEPPDWPDETFFLRTDDEMWHDPHLVHNLAPAPLERVKARRAMVMDTMSALPRCRVIVMTLGLVEAWFDHHTGLYLNAVPPRKSLTVAPDRFELHVLQYEEILAGLHRIHDLLLRHGHSDFRVLLTVSPVPFKSTFTGQDAVAANTYGKSVQRAAAEVFAATHKRVDYFPSYEICTQSPRPLTFNQDNIHVTPKVVDAIMSTVLQAYLDPAARDMGSS